jgi:hypothetical protein
MHCLVIAGGAQTVISLFFERSEYLARQFLLLLLLVLVILHLETGFRFKLELIDVVGVLILDKLDD